MDDTTASSLLGNNTLRYEEGEPGGAPSPDDPITDPPAGGDADPATPEPPPAEPEPNKPPENNDDDSEDDANQPAPGEKDLPESKVAQARKIAGRIKNFVRSYVANLNPKDKSLAWKIGAIGNTGLTAYLAIQTGGSSLLLKSIGTSLASVGTFFINRGIYSLREKDIKKNYEGAQFDEKVAELREKHKRGMDRIARFFGGVSAGSVYGGFLGIGAESIHSHFSNFKVDAPKDHPTYNATGHEIPPPTNDSLTIPVDKAVHAYTHLTGEQAAHGIQAGSEAASHVTLEGVKEAASIGKELGKEAANQIHENVTKENIATIKDKIVEASTYAYHHDTPQDYAHGVGKLLDKQMAFEDKIGGQLLDKAGDLGGQALSKAAEHAPDAPHISAEDLVKVGTIENTTQSILYPLPENKGKGVVGSIKSLFSKIF